MGRAYFVVEGPHDVEVIGRMLKQRRFARVTSFDALEEYWHPLVPRTFPIGGDLNRRVPIPAFFTNGDSTVAVHSAGGATRIGDVARASFAALDTPPDGLGVVLDADQQKPSDVWKRVVATLPVSSAGSRPGDVSGDAPRAGVFVFPDNQAHGTVEDVLLDCAEQAYPTLLKGAKAFVDQISPADATIFINARERLDFAKPAGNSKAVVGCIASILRPGKAVQVSIQDNQWLQNKGALALPAVVQLQGFVDAVVGP
jgi:hypothetical protein